MLVGALAAAPAPSDGLQVSDLMGDAAQLGTLQGTGVRRLTEEKSHTSHSSQIHNRPQAFQMQVQHSCLSSRHA